MRNLAGSPDADDFCELELRRASIPLVFAAEPRRGEVRTRVTGRVGPFTLERAWVYWMVSGPVPMAMARELYAHPEGRRSVRVAGHCGCPPPEEWAQTYATADGFVQCVDHYHIDSAEGLELFVRMAHKHGIVERPIAALGWTVEATEGLLKDMTDDKVRSSIGSIIADTETLGDVNTDDPRIIDLVRRCKEAHP